MHFASTLPKPHEPTLNAKLCQRAYKANPDEKKKKGRVGKGDSHP
tara:strand:+ start:830 stop:964 length:135 start_codon:yes stop_codon:yes gene_type:complete